MFSVAPASYKFLTPLLLLPWRKRQYVAPKCRYPSTHAATPDRRRCWEKRDAIATSRMRSKRSTGLAMRLGRGHVRLLSYVFIIISWKCHRSSCDWTQAPGSPGKGCPHPSVHSSLPVTRGQNPRHKTYPARIYTGRPKRRFGARSLNPQTLHILEKNVHTSASTAPSRDSLTYNRGVQINMRCEDDCDIFSQYKPHLIY